MLFLEEATFADASGSDGFAPNSGIGGDGLTRPKST